MIISIFYAGQELEISFIEKDCLVINRLFLSHHNLGKRLKDIAEIIPKNVRYVVSHNDVKNGISNRKIRNAVLRFIKNLEKKYKIPSKLYDMEVVLSHANHNPDPTYYCPSDWIGLYHIQQELEKTYQAFKKSLPYKED